MLEEILFFSSTIAFNFDHSYIKLSLYFIEYVAQVSSVWDNAQLSLTTKGEIILDSFYLQVGDFMYTAIKHTNLRFNRLSDISLYDRPQYRFRYLLNYILGNPQREFVLRYRFSVTSKFHIIPSIVILFQSAIWAERECMDMHGVKFFGNSDLRRVLCDYGFWGFPGRKDFPLVGISSYVYSLLYLRVFRVRGLLNDIWSIYFQKKLNLKKNELTF